MNKLFVVLLAGTFVLASASVLAERNAGPSGPYEAWTVEDAHRVDRELSTKRKAEKDAAKAAAAKMTPEERAAARKAKRAKPPVGVPLDRRYREPLSPGGPAQRDPPKSNP